MSVNRYVPISEKRICVKDGEEQQRTPMHVRCCSDTETCRTTTRECAAVLSTENLESWQEIPIVSRTRVNLSVVIIRRQQTETEQLNTLIDNLTHFTPALRQFERYLDLLFDVGGENGVGCEWYEREKCL